MAQKSIAFEIEMGNARLSNVPESIAKKIQFKKTMMEKENLADKLQLALERKTAFVESKVKKARATVVKVKEAANKTKQLQECRKNAQLALLESKISSANESKANQLNDKIQKLEIHNVHVINEVKNKDAFEVKKKFYTDLLTKLAAAESRRKETEMNNLLRLKEHAQHVKLVREKKSLVTGTVECI